MRGDCTGTALVFSGRPDPEWPVSEDARKQLQAIWSELKPASSGPPQAPPLGYRGCALRCASGDEWQAYAGVVTYSAASGAVNRRSDPERSFERMLLSTAPRDSLPPGLAA